MAMIMLLKNTCLNNITLINDILDNSPIKNKILVGSYQWNKDCHRYIRVENMTELVEYIMDSEGLL
jgi:hypothetical protein